MQPLMSMPTTTPEENASRGTDVVVMNSTRVTAESTVKAIRVSRSSHRVVSAP